MKWINKGHEFDELGAVFQKNKDILVVSSKHGYEKIKQKLDFLDVDISWCDETQFKSSGIFSILKKYSAKNFERKTIVVSNGVVYKKLISKYNLIPQQNIFTEEQFTSYNEAGSKFLSVFAVYVSNKVYFFSTSFICTTKCNLNCRDCLNFIPYDNNKQHYDIKRLKSDVDAYFRCVDRVGLFHISGGEPFMYPHLAELIEYIHENYRDKIDKLGTVTNSTIIPSKELLETLKKCNVRVEVDDYTFVLHNLEDKFNSLVGKIKEYGIELIINRQEQFFQLFPAIKDDSNLSEDKLLEKFRKCGQICTELKNKKLYNCNWAEFAVQAGVAEESMVESYDLTKHRPEENKALIEYRLGYLTKGYIDFCKYCNGHHDNQNWNPGAIQTKGSLKWDINNPTEVIELTTKNDVNNE